MDDLTRRAVEAALRRKAASLAEDIRACVPDGPNRTEALAALDQVAELAAAALATPAPSA